MRTFGGTSGSARSGCITSGCRQGIGCPARTRQVSATGKVNSVDPAKHTVNVTHEPIKDLGWPSMTMDFPVSPTLDLSAIKPGEKIRFSLGRTDASGNRRIEQLQPTK